MDAISGARAPSPRSPVHERLHESYRSDRRYLREMMRSDADKRGERVGAVLALKSSLDASSARVNAQNAARRRRAEQLAETDARAHEALLSQGLNPYEVTRRREVTQRAAKERSAIERNMRDQQAKVLQRLEVERAQQQQREQLAAEHRAYEKKYQREMGRLAAEERVQAYIVSRTGKETLDPTGKAVRIFPSQETPLQDHSFGLGRNLVHSGEQRQRMIAKVRDKSALHRACGPSQMLLPRESGAGSDLAEELEAQPSSSLPALRASSSSLSEPTSASNASGPTKPRPGEDLRGLNHALVSHSPDPPPVKLPPLGAPSRSSNQRQQSPDVSSPLRKPRTRSVLEQKMLDGARRRQREAAFAHKQVVWGREFEGDAFRADPPALWFKDFDVGVPLSLSFTLTNVSNTFNQFKLLDLEDGGVRELFEVQYERPGRMSAGMTCALAITFTGDRREDIDTWLPVAAPTGVTRVRVRCTCKKAVPVLSATRLRFEDIVAGDSRSIALTLENRGALPFTFRVRRKAPTREEEAVAAGEPPTADAASSSDDTLRSESRSAPEEENPQEADEAVEDPADVAESSEVQVDGPCAAEEDAVEHAELSRDAFCPPASLPLDEAIDDLSEDELQFVRKARSLTRYEPPGFETPITFRERGVVPPYASVPVTFTFSPATPMALDGLEFTLDCFETRPGTSPRADPSVSDASGASAPSAGDEDGAAADCLCSHVVTVSAQATDVPVFVAHERLNLQCCAYGKLYRAQMSVGNRGKIALKMQIKPPKALAGAVEFHPSEGYVQAAAGAEAASTAGDSAPFTVVQVMFRPSLEMWRRVERRGLGSQALGVLAVPVRVLVPDQRVPVFVILVARVSSSSIALSPRALPFGDCCVGHSVSRSLTITNCARVPQRVAAVTRPPEVLVLNDDHDADSGDLTGAGVVLLPLESRRFTVVYEPRAARPLASSARPAVAVPAKPMSTGMAKPTVAPPPPPPRLVIQSATFNRSYSLECSGAGVQAPLVFSQSVVLLGATQRGQRQLASVVCANESEQTQQLELRLPPEAAGASPLPLLRVTPMVATLAPRQRVRIEVEFFARDSVFELADRPFIESVGERGDQETADRLDSSSVSGDTGASLAAQAAPVEAPSVRVSTSRVDAIEPRSAVWQPSVPVDGIDAKPSRSKLPSWAAGIPAEPRSCHVTWTILCFRRADPTGAKMTPRVTPSDAFDAPIQSLTVRSTVLAAPRVRLSAESLRFGQVAIGQATQLALTLHNDGDGDLQLRARPLHALGAFRVVNSTQRVLARGGGRLQLLVEFAPQSAVEFEDELELRDISAARALCPVLRIPLRGRGVNPSLVLTPRDGAVDFGDVLARCRSVQELTLTNASGFPLAFSIAPLPGAADQELLDGSSAAGLPVFAFQPSEGSIPAQASLSVKAVFQPDRARPRHYAQRFRVHVPDAGERHELALAGRCWENQLYVFAPDADAAAATRVVFMAAEDRFDLPPSVSLAPLLHPTALLAPALALSKPPARITLAFDGPETARRLVVGSTLPPTAEGNADAAKAAAALSFELAVDADSPHARLFALEPLKGALSPGQQLVVTASFRPRQEAGEGGGGALAGVFPAAVERPETRVQKWVELRATCTLRGGALWRPAAAGGAAEASDVRVVPLLLRAKLQI